MTSTTTTPGTQDEIDAAHTRYLTIAREREALIDKMSAEDIAEGFVSDKLHDARDEIDHYLLGAAEHLLAVLGYAPVETER